MVRVVAAHVLYVCVVCGCACISWLRCMSATVACPSLLALVRLFILPAQFIFLLRRPYFSGFHPRRRLLPYFEGACICGQAILSPLEKNRRRAESHAGIFFKEHTSSLARRRAI